MKRTGASSSKSQSKRKASDIDEPESQLRNRQRNISRQTDTSPQRNTRDTVQSQSGSRQRRRRRNSRSRLSSVESDTPQYEENRERLSSVSYPDRDSQCAQIDPNRVIRVSYQLYKIGGNTNKQVAYPLPFTSSKTARSPAGLWQND